MKIAPDLNQPLFQFINALDVCAFLNAQLYLIVNCVELGAVWRSKSSGIKSDFFLHSSLTVLQA